MSRTYSGSCRTDLPAGLSFLCFPGTSFVSRAIVVDTSANYMGGNSELLVGEGVDRWLASGEGNDKSLTVVSKFGYAAVSLGGDWPVCL